MSDHESLIKEYKELEKEDLKKRSKSIEEGEALDKKIKNRMEEGEIGVSHGADNHVAIIMFGTATIFTLLVLYFVFGVSPDHYSTLY